MDDGVVVPRKGIRSLQISVGENGVSWGLGVDFLGQDRTQLLEHFGAFDRDLARSIISRMKIDPAGAEIEDIANDLDTMRVTTWRSQSDLDRVFEYADRLSKLLPVGIPTKPPAITELEGSFTLRNQALRDQFMGLRAAITALANAANDVMALRPWEATKPVPTAWHDDALYLALKFKKIAAVRSRKLRFGSSAGGAAGALAELLAVAVEGCKGMTADRVRKALETHPQHELLGVNP